MRLGVDADEVQELAEDGEAAPGVVVAGRVVAVGRVAAGDDHAVGAALERLEDEERVDAAGAGQADDAHVGRHLQAAGAGQVGAGVGAPVADEGDDSRLEVAAALGPLAVSLRGLSSVPQRQGVDRGVDLLVGEALELDALRRADGLAGAAALADARVDLGDAP